MLKAIRIESKYDFFVVKLNKQRLLKVVGVLLLWSVSFTSCQGQSRSKIQLEKSDKVASTQSTIYPEQDQKKDKRGCKKIGERCRLRPGVLGVCSPSAPQNTQLKPWETSAGSKRLHCTPQH